MPVIYYKDKMYASGGGCQSYGGIETPTASLGEDGDYYYQWDTTGEVQITYVKLSNVWHKIAGGDVIIIGGEDYYTDKMQDIVYASVSEEDGLCKIGEVEEVEQ